MPPVLQLLSLIANSTHLSSITPWFTNLGYQNCFISAAFIGMAASSVFLIMIKYGKSLRLKTVSKYQRLVAKDEAGFEGH